MKPTPANAIKPERPIKQGDIEEIVNARIVVDTLKWDLKKAESELLKLELVAIDKVQRLVKQETGPFSLAIAMKAAGSHTPWKDLFAATVGPERVEAELNKTRDANLANSKPVLVVIRDGQIETAKS